MAQASLEILGCMWNTLLKMMKKIRTYSFVIYGISLEDNQNM